MCFYWIPTNGCHPTTTVLITGWDRHENISQLVVTSNVGSLHMKSYHSWMVKSATNITLYFTTLDKRALCLCVFISEKVLSKSRDVYTDSCFLHIRPTHTGVLTERLGRQVTRCAVAPRKWQKTPIYTSNTRKWRVTHLMGDRRVFYLGSRWVSTIVKVRVII